MNDLGNSIGGKTPEDTYTRAQAARLVQRSTDTLKRWHRQGLCVPSESMQAGKLTVWLYTKADMKRLKYLSATQRPGRKKKEKVIIIDDYSENIAHPHQHITGEINVERPAD